MTFTHRLATEADLPAIKALMDVAIAEHLKDFLDPAQVELSKSIMGLDTQLIADRTYFLVEEDGRLAGCGGWSRRATLYGGDHSKDLRDPAPLDPATDAARIPTPAESMIGAAGAVVMSLTTLARVMPQPRRVSESR